MTFVNQEVDVNAFYFAGHELKSYPRQINYGGRAVTFADGLRVSLAQNGKLTYLFNMLVEDSRDVYCLRQEGNQWTLVGTR